MEACTSSKIKDNTGICGRIEVIKGRNDDHASNLQSKSNNASHMSTDYIDMSTTPTYPGVYIQEISDPEKGHLIYII